MIHLNEAIVGIKKMPKQIGRIKYRPCSKMVLKALINSEIRKQGHSADLNCIDTSQITDMSDIFSNMNFTGDISQWDVSNVNDLSYMFYMSNFNGDISGWDVSKDTIMSCMFEGSPLESHPPKWYKD